MQTTFRKTMAINTVNAAARYSLFRSSMIVVIFSAVLFAQQPPYDVYPDAEARYYRVRYEGSTEPGELMFGVNYTVWIPKDVATLRGVITVNTVGLKSEATLAPASGAR